MFRELVGWHRGVDQAPFCRGARIDPFARKQHLQGPLAPDRPAHRHHRRRTKEADLHTGRAEGRALLGEGEIAGGNQLAPSGCGDTAHHRNDRLRDALDHGHQLNALVENALILARRPIDQFAEIMTGREHRAVGGQDDDAHVASLADVRQRAGQLRHELQRQRIPLLGAVQRQRGDPVCLGNVNT